MRREFGPWLFSVAAQGANTEHVAPLNVPDILLKSADLFLSCKHINKAVTPSLHVRKPQTKIYF